MAYTVSPQSTGHLGVGSAPTLHEQGSNSTSYIFFQDPTFLHTALVFRPACPSGCWDSAFLHVSLQWLLESTCIPVKGSLENEMRYFHESKDLKTNYEIHFCSSIDCILQLHVPTVALILIAGELLCNKWSKPSSLSEEVEKSTGVLWLV